jgi:phytoene dehydrogenase-like protein
MYDVIIIGAGHNGLAAAALLARAGQRVLVAEQRPMPGGRASREEIFDGVVTSPVFQHDGIVRPRLMRALGLEGYGLSYEPLDPFVVAPAGDGRVLTLWQNVRRTAEEIARFSRRDAARWPEYLRFMERAASLLRDTLDITPPPLSATDPMAFWDMAQTLLRFRLMPSSERTQLLRAGAMSINDFLGEWFETPLLKAALAAPALRGSYAGPWAPGTAALLLYRRALGEGKTPRDGVAAVTTALLKACRDAGVELRLETPVEAIVCNGREHAPAEHSGNGKTPGSNGSAHHPSLPARPRATAVRLGKGDVVMGDVIVSDVDAATTLLELLEPDLLSSDIAHIATHYKTRGNTAIMHLLLSRLPTVKGLESGDKERWRGPLHVGADLETVENAWSASKYGRWSDTPVLEAWFPSLRQTATTPAGQHLLTVYATAAPYQLREGSWDDRRDQFAEVVLRTLETVMPDVRNAVAQQWLLTPPDLERRYGLRGGHLYHGEHSLDQLFVSRPAMALSRYRTPIENLYLCGSGSHPGGGITGAAGANAAQEILRDLGVVDVEAKRRKAKALGTLGAGLALVGAGFAAKSMVETWLKPSKPANGGSKGDTK